MFPGGGADVSVSSWTIEKWIVLGRYEIVLSWPVGREYYSFHWKGQ
jgi:hypothetical protein